MVESQKLILYVDLFPFKTLREKACQRAWLTCTTATTNYRYPTALTKSKETQQPGNGLNN